MTTAQIGIHSGNVIVPYTSVTKQSKWINIASAISAGARFSIDSVTKAVARFSMDSAGVWSMEANIKVVGDTTTGADFAINIAGIVFDATADQSVEGQVDSATMRAAGQYAFAVGNAGTIYIQFQASTTGENNVAVLYSLNSTILNAEPTWASLGTTAAAALEGVVAADIYIANASTTPGLLNYYEEGTFTMTMVGCTASPTGTAYFTMVGKVVTIIIPGITGTSNANLMYFSGIPTRLSPARGVRGFCGCYDNGAKLATPSQCRIVAGDTNIYFYPTAADSSLWTTSGGKGTELDFCMTYIVN
jgi:hypothetical protein